MDENPLGCNNLHCSLQLVLCECTVTFSHVSVERTEDEDISFLLPFLLFGLRISCDGSSPGDILLQTFHITEDSNKRPFFCQFRFSSPYFNKTILCTVSKTENISVPPVFSTRLSNIHSSPYFHPLYLSRVFKQNKGKLIIALFAPLTGVLLKVVSRICAQRLWNITHPGYSYVLLAPLCYGAAVVFRVLQADLGSLHSIVVLGIIHGAAEVIDRSTMVVIDHICHLLWQRKSAPWGSFRTPRRERLMADIAIMSMLSESAAIISVNGVLYLYRWTYLENSSFVNLLHSFAIHTSVPLLIEWFFNSASLAIETRYQNMPVMAIWRRQWKRHILVAIVNTVPIAVFLSGNLLSVVHELFTEANVNQQTCKMPFT